MAESFEIRLIEPGDDADIARIIRTVMPEFGAKGPGYAINDPEVSAMYEAYHRPDAVYFVLLREGRVVGGGGIGPLKGAAADTCELRKMYFLPEARGLGYGRDILERCLAVAKEKGYARCYLETLEHMDQAKRLYEKTGFKKLGKPMGATGHFGCDAWYVKIL